MRIHKTSSFVVLSHFGSSTTPLGNRACVCFLSAGPSGTQCALKLGRLCKDELPPFLLTSQPMGDAVRGSSGEGIWIIRLKSGSYRKNYSGCIRGNSELRDIMMLATTRCDPRWWQVQRISLPDSRTFPSLLRALTRSLHPRRAEIHT